jgi:hypothetical protein
MTAPKAPPKGANGTAPEMTTVGENVRYAVDGTTLTVVIDLSYRGGLSESGKTVRVASTLGSAVIAGTDVKLGINAFVKAPKN